MFSKLGKEYISEFENERADVTEMIFDQNYLRFAMKTNFIIGNMIRFKGTKIRLYNESPELGLPASLTIESNKAQILLNTFNGQAIKFNKWVTEDVKNDILLLFQFMEKKYKESEKSENNSLKRGFFST